MTPQAVIIFAAGLGTRMGALTRDRPKPLIEVAGRPLIDHALALARAAGISRVVVNTHAHAGQMRAHLARTAPGARLSHEAELLETGGGLKRALPLLGPGPVFTLNADMVWTGANPLAALAAAWKGQESDGGALLALVPREAATGHAGPGDFFLDAGRLRRRAGAATAPFVYAGAQIIDPAALAGFDAAVFSLNPVWDALIARGRLRGIVHPGGWVDVGRPEGIALAEALLAR
jgi:MurNAc alpha-1-phosphate uridylyltransferase